MKFVVRETTEWYIQADTEAEAISLVASEAAGGNRARPLTSKWEVLEDGFDEVMENVAAAAEASYLPPTGPPTGLDDSGQAAHDLGRKWRCARCGKVADYMLEIRKRKVRRLEGDDWHTIHNWIFLPAIPSRAKWCLEHAREEAAARNR